jgi:hypothetical protein
MVAWSQNYGDWVDYYRFDRDRTTWDDLYNEVTGTGRSYQNPIRLSCLHVTFLVGENEWDEKGFYMSDALRATIPYNVYTQSGMVLADINTGEYMNDRLMYKTKVYRITQINESGQIQERPTVVSIDALQLKSDEMVEDAVWLNYSERPTP